MSTSRLGVPNATAPAQAEAIANRLLHAATPAEVIDVLLQADRHTPDITVLWSTHWPHNIVCHPAAPHDANLAAVAVDAVSVARMGGILPANLRVLHDDGDQTAAVLHCASGCPELLEAATHRLGEVLAIQGMQESVARLEQAEMLQRSLYAIADMAGSDLDMPDMLRGLHRIVSDLMYAENFYIALYDSDRDSLRFLYFADVVDTQKLSPDEEIPLSRFEHGLTWYLIRDRKPLMGSTEQLRQQVSGPLRVHGADSSDWLGVPMLRDGHARGALVVQSYLAGSRYTTAEMSLLAFVAEHTLTALERKASQEVLEQRVRERTRQLAETNVQLRHEVEERERGERLQAALYRLAALANADGAGERFYHHVHAIVGELVNARNFYIALVSEDGSTVSFPYAQDQHERDWKPRTGRLGLTEYVLRTGKPQLVDVARMQALIEAGEVESEMMVKPTLMWLGVPLLGADSAIGVVAVQSYDAGIDFDERDAELLTFVSYQLANSIQRRKADDALKQANASLEQRVEERTIELRKQIAERERIDAQLQHQIMHDALTGLPNRIYLLDRLDRGIARLQRYPEQRLGLLYIDVDRFKVVNDSLGHLAGDEVLKEVARRLESCVREPDVTARLAGDEFAILIEQAQLPETAAKVARRVLQSMQPAMAIGDRELRASISIGIAVVGQSYRSADHILHDADIALYRAKAAGRNRFVLFDDAMQHTAMGVLDLEQALRDALLNDEFMPYFQPLVRLTDGAIVGYEALLRWNHPQHGVLLPGDFLKVAEESGLIEAIDWRMFRLAMECSRDLIRDNVYVTLNVSPRLFQMEGFDRRLLELAADSGFDPAHLRLEVTEGTLLVDPEAMVAVLQRLREASIEAVLDDFGTGYSSLGHVHRFPLKMIKIDRSFVSPFTAGVSPRSSAVIEAILALGRSLAIEIVAEGIETEYQREVLMAMGCEYGQGYLFAQPQPAAHWLAGG
ncbi:bifunctional diguanylate cyclase/phosphodiesterase [Pseudoxanthomonas wuyuanensis]|uniref:Diguanylate cyclase/phosphodiesterase with GAF sensor n=1 Tax=Pseudoxanthomonas wuyuanensis TaxID=1073196 RepID=A0A286D9J9_9GAMM|nr:EAL domain-containing protein [Pseudoxanthomonas wuyuanensis]KAF1718809.1 bifunctional diguanylate cyclase/phosphodiesterase [Pseudoxanthomonas wuyuanensis]SOD55331.1 diguanylate cyclase/phosphodiesterase with GAF sensor [Pseudoxanthomonas wuyuanensis]